MGRRTRIGRARRPAKTATHIHLRGKAGSHGHDFGSTPAFSSKAGVFYSKVMNKLIHILFNIPHCFLILFHSIGYCLSSQAVSDSTLQFDQLRKSTDVKLSTSGEKIENSDGNIFSTLSQNPMLSMLPDSLEPRTYSLAEVVVTATRSPLNRWLSPGRVSQLSKARFSDLGGFSLGDVLIGQPGVFVSEY